MHLSKSKFIAGIQCLKRLYLEIHQPDLAESADEATEARLNQGQEVGLVAQQRFPGGVCVQAGHTELEQALEKTRELIAHPEIPAIFEAAFQFDDVLVRVDILERLSDDHWRMIEVKSSTDVKDYHPYDVAIQRHVVAGSGLRIAGACLMHLNRDYVYDGNRYDLDQLFTTRDLTKEIDQLESKLDEMIRMQKGILALPEPPEIAPGSQCSDPFDCEFLAHCNKPVPLDHISLLPGIRSARVEDLLRLGYTSVQAIPTDYPLSERERRACDCMTAGVPWFGDGLREELKRLEYPLFFMDFETIFDALPRFAGMRPYDHLPFQWSVHIQESPGADARQYEFLARDQHDPRKPFIESLCEVLGQKGQIVVYNQTFESTRLADLAAWIPVYAGAIADIQNRVWDLLPVVRANVYHPAFAGSYSLKSVLPALVPELRYDGMAVADGGQAGLVWKQIIGSQTDAAETERLINALLAYCRQDTLGMVKILERLRQA